MAFNKEELRQLEDLRTSIALDVKGLIQPLINNDEHMKKQLDQLVAMKSEDVGVAYEDIAVLNI